MMKKVAVFGYVALILLFGVGQASAASQASATLADFQAGPPPTTEERGEIERAFQSLLKSRGAINRLAPPRSDHYFTALFLSFRSDALEGKISKISYILPDFGSPRSNRSFLAFVSRPGHSGESYVLTFVKGSDGW